MSVRRNFYVAAEGRASLLILDLLCCDPTNVLSGFCFGAELKETCIAITSALLTSVVLFCTRWAGYQLSKLCVSVTELHGK